MASQATPEGTIAELQSILDALVQGHEPTGEADLASWLARNRTHARLLSTHPLFRSYYRQHAPDVRLYFKTLKEFKQQPDEVSLALALIEHPLATMDAAWLYKNVCNHVLYGKIKNQTLQGMRTRLFEILQTSSESPSWNPGDTITETDTWLNLLACMGCNCTHFPLDPTYGDIADVCSPNLGKRKTLYQQFIANLTRAVPSKLPFALLTVSAHELETIKNVYARYLIGEQEAIKHSPLGDIADPELLHVLIGCLFAKYRTSQDRDFWTALGHWLRFPDGQNVYTKVVNAIPNCAEHYALPLIIANGKRQLSNSLCMHAVLTNQQAPELVLLTVLARWMLDDMSKVTDEECLDHIRDLMGGVADEIHASCDDHGDLVESRIEDSPNTLAENFEDDPGDNSLFENFTLVAESDDPVLKRRTLVQALPKDFKRAWIVDCQTVEQLLLPLYQTLQGMILSDVFKSPDTTGRPPLDCWLQGAVERFRVEVLPGIAKQFSNPGGAKPGVGDKRTALSGVPVSTYLGISTPSWYLDPETLRLQVLVPPIPLFGYLAQDLWELHFQWSDGPHSSSTTQALKAPREHRYLARSEAVLVTCPRWARQVRCVVMRSGKAVRRPWVLENPDEFLLFERQTGQHLAHLGTKEVDLLVARADGAQIITNRMRLLDATSVPGVNVYEVPFDNRSLVIISGHLVGAGEDVPWCVVREASVHGAFVELAPQRSDGAVPVATIPVFASFPTFICRESCVARDYELQIHANGHRLESERMVRALVQDGSNDLYAEYRIQENSADTWTNQVVEVVVTKAGDGIEPSTAGTENPAESALAGDRSESSVLYPACSVRFVILNNLAWSFTQRWYADASLLRVATLSFEGFRQPTGGIQYEPGKTRFGLRRIRGGSAVELAMEDGKPNAPDDLDFTLCLEGPVVRWSFQREAPGSLAGEPHSLGEGDQGNQGMVDLWYRDLPSHLLCVRWFSASSHPVVHGHGGQDQDASEQKAQPALHCSRTKDGLFVFDLSPLAVWRPDVQWVQWDLLSSRPEDALDIPMFRVPYRPTVLDGPTCTLLHENDEFPAGSGHGLAIEYTCIHGGREQSHCSLDLVDTDGNTVLRALQQSFRSNPEGNYHQVWNIERHVLIDGTYRLTIAVQQVSSEGAPVDNPQVLHESWYSLVGNQWRAGAVQWHEGAVITCNAALERCYESLFDEVGSMRERYAIRNFELGTIAACADGTYTAHGYTVLGDGAIQMHTASNPYQLSDVEVNGSEVVFSLTDRSGRPPHVEIATGMVTSAGSARKATIELVKGTICVQSCDVPDCELQV